MTPWLVWLAGGAVTAMLLGFTGAIIYQAVAKDDINTGLIGVAGPLLAIGFGVWREVFAYRFDGSKTSTAQSAVLTELARNKSQ
jgi:tetrahydromethanopterin S-methyltransferase subunit D